jgi:nucleoid-associated protein YgaU
VLAGSTIGIKIADGSYYPVLSEGFTGTKRLTLTTVKDGQDRVQIDLYRGEGHILDNAQYIGSLIIENIPPASQGEPEIELILGLGADGELTAEASDRSTGESQTFSIGMRTLEQDETYEVPDFAVEPREPEDAAESEPSGEPDDGLTLDDLGGRLEETFDEVPLTGDAYPVSGADRRRDHLHHRSPVRRGGVEPFGAAASRGAGRGSARPRGSAGVTILLVVLVLALIAALGYVVYRLVWGPPITSFSSLFCPQAVETIAAPAEPSAPTEPAPPAATEPAAPAEPVAPAADAGTTTTGDQSATSAGVTYRIKRGDTLWDLSSTYYRNPWLYPVIAKANGIKNPDLIIAGARIFIPER